MSLKRNAYKGITLPENETYLIVRPCFTAICYDNKPAALLLSALLFRYSPSPDEDMEKITSFPLQRTQAELVEDMCGMCSAKSIHDVAIPGLEIFGYLSVDETTSPITYTVHLERVREALSVYHPQRRDELENFLIEHVTLKGFIPNKRKFQSQLENSLTAIRESSNSIRESSNSIRESSNSRRGPKPRCEAAADAKKETPKNIKNNKNIKEHKEYAPPHVVAPPSVLSFENESHSQNSPPIEQEKTPSQDLLLEVPKSAPDMTGPWSHEKVARYAEYCNKDVYREAERKRQLKAAVDIHKDDPALTLEQFKAAYDERNDEWWKENQGKLHVSHMKGKEKNSGIDRVHAMLDRIKSRSTKRPPPTPPALGNGVIHIGADGFQFLTQVQVMKMMPAERKEYSRKVNEHLETHPEDRRFFAQHA